MQGAACAFVDFGFKGVALLHGATMALHLGAQGPEANHGCTRCNRAGAVQPLHWCEQYTFCNSARSEFCGECAIRRHATYQRPWIGTVASSDSRAPTCGGHPLAGHRRRSVMVMPASHKGGPAPAGLLSPSSASIRVGLSRGGRPETGMCSRVPCADTPPSGPGQTLVG